MPQQGMPQVGDVIAEKYKIEKVLGEGGMGAVFAAAHQITGKRVALKWMRQELTNDEEAVQRFIREAQAAGRIDHPNVVDVYDVGKEGKTVFLVMEYLYGAPLTALLEHGPQDPTEIIQLLMPALRGVAAAHKQGVVHRDLKPDNIFMCRSPDGAPREAKVLDFGISKVTAQGSQLSPRLTRTGAVMGTPYYMSPEQVRGARDIGPQVDVYAFGVILYEALAGKVPFHADSFSALVLEIATATPKPLRELRPDLPPELEAVVMKAMAREPENRYPNIETFAQALEPFGGGVCFEVTSHNVKLAQLAKTGQPGKAATPVSADLPKVTSTPFSSEAPIAVPTRRLPMAAAAGGLAAVLVLGGVAYWSLSGKSSEPPRNLVRPAGAQPSVLQPAPAPAANPAPALQEEAKKPEEKPPQEIAKNAEPKPSAALAPAPKPAETQKAASGGSKTKRERSSKRAKTTATRVAQPKAVAAPELPKTVPTKSAPSRPRGSRTGGLNLEEF